MIILYIYIYLKKIKYQFIRTRPVSEILRANFEVIQMFFVHLHHIQGHSNLPLYKMQILDFETFLARQCPKSIK